MNRLKYLGITLAVVISLFLIFSQTVYASIDVGTFDQAAYAYYIDPGTGSIITQPTFGLSLNAYMRRLPLEFGHWSFATCNRCKATLKANSAHHTKPGLAPNATASVIP